jgi:hypothetical protein
MRTCLRGVLSTVALVTALTLSLACVEQASADSAGAVHFVRAADSGFDQYTSNPAPEAQTWLRDHMWRMTAWSPYFDSRTSWYPQAWMYDDAYAIYKGSQLATQHPEWIMRDSAGNKLYIPYGCSGGTCSQYAGDISNPAFRHYWIESAATSLAHGYRGLFIDDVNMEERVGNGQGNSVAPIDSVTGQSMSATKWREDMAQFMAEIRGAFPSAEIVHNAIWFANSAAGTTDPSIRHEIESANYIFLERGLNDSGLTGGNGSWSVNALLTYADEVHALGKGVIMDGTSSEQQAMAYNLAGYFMISTGNDAVGASGQTPTSWWSGWNVNLGEATGPRYQWNGMLRRDFTGGMALLNAPGAATQTVRLPSAMRNANGSTVTSVTLSASSGAILTSLEPATTPPSTPHPPAPAPTQTTVHTVAVITATPTEPHVSKGASQGATKSTTRTLTRSASGTKTTSHGKSSKRSRHHRKGKTARHRVVIAKVSGTVHRVGEGHVTILIEVPHNHKWVLSRRTLVSVDNRGHFVRLLRLSPARHFRVLAVYGGTARYRPSSSHFHVVVVRGS